MNLLQRCPSSLSLFVLFSLLLSLSLFLSRSLFLSLSVSHALSLSFRVVGSFAVWFQFVDVWDVFNSDVISLLGLPYFGDILVYIKI